MARDVTDTDGVQWTLVQAFAGVSESAEARSAAERLATRDGHVAVVCTPSGGAQTVRTELPIGWEERLTDAQLLDAIASGAQTPNGATR